MKYDAVVVASGKGTRMRLNFNKVFLTIGNKTILERACLPFLEDKDCQRVVVVTQKENFELVVKHEKILLAEGGAERKDSVCSGLALCKSRYVLIHDGARPFLESEDLEKLKNELKTCDAAILARRSTETVKRVVNGVITETLDREQLMFAQTPQGFRRKLLKEAYASLGERQNYTDDASVMEAYGQEVRVVPGSPRNRKITYIEDLP
ncbi:MAG: 2-C-methyl-D-erythritol 4-phosphate cytidylyltransferase [Erysipelotrichaceae bacterium]|jgi:2-C-methyl-D-erythritol 4-phosphate cytidylyltransferase|nr:2-C-methyl-D-erythritol 4-phosphate cytidylyltransferase [Erysipelotrichaceae bacterium]